MASVKNSGVIHDVTTGYDPALKNPSHGLPVRKPAP